MAPRTAKTDEQLAHGAYHLVYEVQMLDALTEYIMHKAIDTRVAGLPESGMPARNAVLESFAVHARVLHSFLYPGGLIQDADVLAGDFFASGSWTPEAETKNLEPVRDRVGPEIAHLSYKRHDPSVAEEVAKWPTQAIRDDLVERLRTFADEAERLADDDREKLKAAVLGKRQWVRDELISQPTVVSSATSTVSLGGTVIVPPNPPKP